MQSFFNKTVRIDFKPATLAKRSLHQEGFSWKKLHTSPKVSVIQLILFSWWYNYTNKINSNFTRKTCKIALNCNTRVYSLLPDEKLHYRYLSETAEKGKSKKQNLWNCSFFSNVTYAVQNFRLNYVSESSEIVGNLPFIKVTTA